MTQNHNGKNLLRKNSVYLTMLIIFFIAAVTWLYHLGDFSLPWQWDDIADAPEVNLLVPAPNVSSLSSGVILTDVSAVVNQVKPSIVTVAVKSSQFKRSGNLPLDPFSLMFGIPSFRNPGILEQEDIQRDIGTGFVVDGAGLVVTNKHVVSGVGQKYIVIDSEDREYEVKEIYRDSENDLALLQVEGLQVPALTMGNSDALQVGQGVFAVGTALGEFRHTVTTGVVSGLGRTITASDSFGSQQETIKNIIQTDAAINAGNSGGPLLNSYGQVIGVNVAVTAGAENIGFALPIKVVQESLNVFESTGRFERPFLGVNYQMISEKAALFNEIPQGAYLTSVAAGSAADKAGLKEGDIITKFAGEALKVSEKNAAQSNLLTAIINRHKIGERLAVEYYRDGKQQHTEVVLEKRQE